MAWTVSGIPPALTEGTTDPDYDAILDDPSMTFAEDPTRPGELRASCQLVEEERVAFPPRRLLTLADGLHERGVRTFASSICQARAYKDVALSILEAAT